MSPLYVRPAPTPVVAADAVDPIEGLTRPNVQRIALLEAAALEGRSGVDRGVDAVSHFCGTTTFVWVHVLGFGAWVTLNLAPGLPHLDAYPFPFLTFMVSLEAILLSTFILMSQNRQGLILERRNRLDLQINLLAEQESTMTLVLLTRVAQKLGVEGTDDPELLRLQQAASPERMVRQIDEQTRRPDAPPTPG
jgi:uncharacterized membrane protein